MREIFILVLFGLVFSCNSKPSTTETPRPLKPKTALKKTKVLKPVSTQSFPLLVGSWSKEFSVDNAKHVATYEISTEKIKYSLKGKLNANYVINFDHYADNRWVGHTEKGKYYVIFLKDVSKKKITLYKKHAEDLKTAMSVPIPESDDMENHTGWNIFQRN